jgi:hypothetical protein
MKQIILIFTLLAVIILDVKAQDQPTKFEVGFSLNQFQKDFGLGLHVVSPYFLKSTIAVKVGANLQWLEYYDGTETTWTPYQNLQLGIRSRSEIVKNKIYIYGEGGLLTILPNSDFSSSSAEFGGYGLFGFEFKPASNFAYFIDLGGSSGAIADELDNLPIYSNGFFTNVGLRIGL